MRYLLALIALLVTVLIPSGLEAQSNLPDLQVSGFQILSPATLHCGGAVVKIAFTETNAGRTDSGPYTLDFVLQTHGFSLHIARPNLPAFSSRVVRTTVTWYNGPCDCAPIGTITSTYSLLIDAQNVVVESNEGNNMSNIATLPWSCP